jgi:transcriptional regulator with XRE-family HTH domain
MQEITTKISPSEVSKRLGSVFDGRGESQKLIAKGSGVNQSQVSRILSGKFKNAESKNVIKLCKYANISLKKIHDAPPDPSKNTVLMAAIGQIWDGSDNHAEAIAGVLIALKKIQSV